MKIGVTGATGQLGNFVIEELKKRTEKGSIVALVRNVEKGKKLGVEVRAFDYEKPKSLPGALEDIDRMILISANELGKRARQHSNVIDAAKKAGVKLMVYTSLLHADTTSMENLAGEHLATENALKESGMDYIILRNGWYTENYTASVPAAMKNGAFVGSAGDGKISSAARIDYAEAAAVVITKGTHKNKTYELAGDDHYTLSDLAAEISKQTGKDIPYKNLPEKEYAKILKGAGLPDMYAEAFAGWDVGASKDDLYDTSHELSKLIGRPTTPMPHTVKKTLEAAG